MFLLRKFWYFILRLFFDFEEIVERFIIPPANAGRISTTDLVNRIFMFCEVYSGKTMYPNQEQFSKRVIRSVLENDGAEITALFARQCIPANQKVYMSDGSFKRIADIEQGDNILSLTVDNTLENDVVVDKWSTGVRERLKIKTIRGFEIECSPKHLFLTPQGWREASLLKTRQQFKNSRIGAKGGRRDTLGGETVYHRHQNYCASINAGVFGTQSIGNDRAKLLGYLVSDGHYSKSSVKFTNIRPSFLSEVEKIALSEFNVRIDKEKKGKGFDYHFRAEKDHVNELMEFLKDIEIYNQVSENKRIPKILFNCGEKEISLFLNRLYSGGGWVTSKESGIEIGIGVQSFDIAEEIRFLLHKFGVSCVIQEQFKGKKQKKRFWKVRIGRSEDVLRFFERIGYIYGKYPQSIKAKKFAEQNIKRRFYFIDNDVSWDTITSIEPLESVEMFDIETHNNHNFICNGFVVHNSGKSETIALTSGGLMIILPQLANMVMFLDDPRLTMFKDGFWIGIFAPTQRQAQITYGRIKARIQSKTAQAVLNDPEFRLGFTTSNGQTVALSNGSFVTSISASDGSNIEGESFKLLLLEECQDISNLKITKCLTGDTRILLSNGLYKRIDEIVRDENDELVCYENNMGNLSSRVPYEFYDNGIQSVYEIILDNGEIIRATENHKFYTLNKKTKGKKCSFRTVKEIWESFNNDRPLRIGIPDSLPYFAEEQENDYEKGLLTGYFLGDGCLRGIIHFIGMPNSVKRLNKIVTLLFGECKNSIKYNDNGTNEIWFKYCESYVKIKEYFKNMLMWNKKGKDKCLPEKLYSKNFYKGFIEALIETDGCVGMCYVKPEISFANISEKLVRQLKDILLKFGIHASYSSRNNNKNGAFGIGKNEDIHFLRIKSVLDIRNFADNFKLFEKQNLLKSAIYVLKDKQTREKSKYYSDLFRFCSVKSIKYAGEQPTYCVNMDEDENGIHNIIANNMVSGQSISPMGAAYNATMVKIGTATTFKGNFYEAIQRNKKDMESKTYHSATTRNHFEYDWTVVVKYNPKYAKYIEGEKKKLGENSDSFRMSYKLEWIIERSMFIDIEKFEKNNLEPLFERQSYDMDATHVVGIDVGGKSDSTVITVIEVDWSVPVVQESIQDFETGEDLIYTAYNTYIKDWYEIIGVPDYEEQFSLIMDYLSNFNIVRIVIDATKEAALAHRIRANMSCEVIPFVFSTKSKSEIYSYLTAEVETGRARVPGGSNSIQSIEYKKFIEQLAELQKGYSGQYLRVAHSSENGHDDFPDSWALAVWGCSMAYIPDHTETQINRFTEKTKMEVKSMKHKNSFTAKRR